MKPIRLFLLLAVLLFAVPSYATIAKVQIVAKNACGVSLTCAITVSSTGTGHFAWIMASSFTGAANNEIASVSDGTSVWVVPAGCAGFSAGGGTVSCAYTLAQASGKTTVTVTWGTATPPVQIGFVYEEASFSGSSIAFDTSGVTTNSVNTTRTGQTLSPSGSNDVIMQYVQQQNTSVTAISGSYTDFNGSNLASETGAYGVLYNSSSGTAPTWTFSGNTVSMVNAIAFKEASAVKRLRGAVIN